MKMSPLMLSVVMLLAPSFSGAQAGNEFKLGSSLAADVKEKENFDVNGIHSAQGQKLTLNQEFTAKRAAVMKQVARIQAKIKDSVVPVFAFQVYIDTARENLAHEFALYEAKFDSICATEQAYAADLFKINPAHPEAMKPRVERSIASVNSDQTEAEQILNRK